MKNCKNVRYAEKTSPRAVCMKINLLYNLPPKVKATQNKYPKIK